MKGDTNPLYVRDPNFVEPLEVIIVYATEVLESNLGGKEQMIMENDTKSLRRTRWLNS